MSGLVVEGGIYFLLLFTPLAFGGVESWAIGIFQIAAAVVFVAWALGEGSPWGASRARLAPSNHASLKRPLRVLWACIVLFVLLVLLQVTPLPPSAIRALAPATHSLYASSIPGYAEGEPFRSEDLPGWLLDSHGDAIPAVDGSSPPGAELPLGESGWTAASSPWRTLSVYPFMTWERLTVLLGLIAVFVVVTSHFRARHRIRRLLACCVTSVAIVSIRGTIQRLTWNGKLYWIREGNYSNGNIFGPFAHRNNYAGFAVTVLPLAMCMAFAALARVRRGEREATPPLLLSSFASVVICAGIFYSLSRAGMLSAALAAAIVGALLLYYGKHMLELGLLAGLLLLAGSFVAWIGSSEEVVERVQTMTEGETTPSMAMRYTAWENSLGLVKENWLVGTGLGTFRFAFMRYAPPGRNWWKTADNEFLEVFTDTGFAGGIIALIGLAAFFTAVVRPWRFRGRSGRYVFAGLVAGIIALLVHSNVHSNLQVPGIALFVVVLGGALLNQVRLYEKERSRGAATEAPPEGAGDAAPEGSS